MLQWLPSSIDNFSTIPQLICTCWLKVIKISMCPTKYCFMDYLRTLSLTGHHALWTLNSNLSINCDFRLDPNFNWTFLLSVLHSDCALGIYHWSIHHSSWAILVVVGKRLTLGIDLNIGINQESTFTCY